jgi:hypothetical protein
MSKLGWSSPFSQRMVDGWETYSKAGGFAARADQVRNNILDAALQHTIRQTETITDDL